MGGPPPSDDVALGTYHRGRISRKVALALVATGAVAVWWRWRPFRVRIEGSSMYPTLRVGDLALVVRARRVGVGDVVVVEHPERPGFELVKRIAAIDGEHGPGPDLLWVRGDAPGASSDSRSFGPVGSELVRGRVLLVWWPPGRWRRVRSVEPEDLAEHE